MTVEIGDPCSERLDNLAEGSAILLDHTDRLPKDVAFASGLVSFFLLLQTGTALVGHHLVCLR